MEVLNKTTQTPNCKREKYVHKTGLFMLAIGCFPSKIVNASQPMVGKTLWVNTSYYPVDGYQVHLNTDARISESRDSRFKKSR